MINAKCDRPIIRYRPAPTQKKHFHFTLRTCKEGQRPSSEKFKDIPSNLNKIMSVIGCVFDVTGHRDQVDSSEKVLRLFMRFYGKHIGAARVSLAATNLQCPSNTIKDGQVTAVTPKCICPEMDD